MFCSKCGKEIMDEAVICPSCGCPTNNFSAQSPAQPTVNIYSSDYPIIKEFAEKAKTIKTLGILATIFMLGIGLIFSIIIWLSAKKIAIPEITTTNPNEIAEFESAKRKYALGCGLSFMPITGIGISIIIGMIVMAFI